MAVVSICSNMSYKEHVRPIAKLVRQCESGFGNDCIAFQKMCRGFCSSTADDLSRRCDVIAYSTGLCMKAKKRQGTDAFGMIQKRRSLPFKTTTEVYASSSKDVLHRGKPFTESYASETSTNERELKALESYFSKLHNEVNDVDTQQMPSCSTSNFETDCSQLPGTKKNLVNRNGQSKSEKGLGCLDNYLGKLKTGVDSQENVSSNVDDATRESESIRIPYSVSGESPERSKEMVDKLNSYMKLESKDDESISRLFGDENFQDLQIYDETSDLSFISILASINIAVFLFEIASPIRNSDVEHLSLPLIYGAKINQLILDGEWWRLVTPMFLHSGFLHVALGCWVLLTLGPQVCRGYGSFTFFLIYILGGISGNLTSFIHTPELTVGGTGPVFAIIGAWLIYQFQNKEVIPKEVSESMFQKMVIATALSFVLSSFGRIDDWTHLGAACAGLVYGFLTCPTLQLDNTSSKNGQEEGIALLRHGADPFKSLITFVAFIIILSSLFFVLQPQLGMLDLDEFV